mgnify:CR=1 FL=1
MTGRLICYIYKRRRNSFSAKLLYGMLSKYKYYTGVIFKAYTYGIGEAIVKGGRYDRLLHQFGKEAPAVGFCVVVDSTLSSSSSWAAK